MTAANNGPMARTRVVDLTRILAGPFCAMMLGDMGAEIIIGRAAGHRRRHPRLRPPFAAGEAAYFSASPHKVSR